MALDGAGGVWLSYPHSHAEPGSVAVPHAGAVLRPMHQLKFLVPNAFTAASMLLGLASVVSSAAGDFELASWMILWGVMLDKLDGTSARLLGASSRIGAELDSFSDFVVFGVAPAALVYFRLRAPDLAAHTNTLFVTCCAGGYVVATATRLARFNISSPPMGDRYFYGVPTTMCGAIVASGYLTWTKYALDPEALRFAPWLFVLLAALMVSTLKLPKLKRRKSTLLNVVQFSNVAAGYVVAPMRLFPEYLFGLAAGYTVGGLVLCVLAPPRPEQADERATAAAAPSEPA